jgi:hypothetical protein
VKEAAINISGAMRDERGEYCNTAPEETSLCVPIATFCEDTAMKVMTGYTFVWNGTASKSVL